MTGRLRIFFRHPLQTTAPALRSASRKTSWIVVAALLLPAFTLPGSPITFRGLDLHPDVMFRPYTTGPILADSSALSARTIMAFRDLLAQYEQRQGVDDNFTIRVTDNRTGRLLEVYEMKADRARYEREGSADWEEVDRKRREATRRLVDKYVQRGMPRGTVSARWGRLNQVYEAREAEAAFIMYEVRLARLMGLSLLATEIGTVETFNQDRRVSSVGARGRYQMMPATLREHALNRYDLTTAAGNKVSVAEEWHPLLTMEPAFTTLRGYTNAVGHEIPGLSAYHAGPGNIFRIYRLFMERPDRFVPGATVADAYVWAITDGFDAVSSGSSFGSYSRGYLPSAYGSLRAIEHMAIDTSRTMLAERVQLRTGREAYLSRLLRTLDAHRDRLVLPVEEEGAEESLYRIFRDLNPHLSLPATTGDGVPVRGDVRLLAKAQGKAVRFFLPLGASDVLADAGLDVIDEDATFRFDHGTYTRDAAHKTVADLDYEELVRDIADFGFTQRNRTRLLSLKARFTELARTNPTPYRKMQLKVISIHERLWTSPQWDALSSATASARLRLREG